MQKYLSEEFVAVRLKFRDTTELREKYKITTTFAVAFLKPDGALDRMLPWADPPADALLEFLQKVNAPYRAARSIEWADDLDTVVEACSKSGRPVVIFFVEKNDAESVAMLRAAESVPVASLQEPENGFVQFVRVEVEKLDRKAEWVKKLKVKKLPTIAFYDAMNETVIDSTQDTTKLADFLTQAIRAYEDQ